MIDANGLNCKVSQDLLSSSPHYCSQLAKLEMPIGDWEKRDKRVFHDIHIHNRYIQINIREILISYWSVQLVGASHPATTNAVLIEALVIKPVVTAMGIHIRNIYIPHIYPHQRMSFSKAALCKMLVRFSCFQDLNLETIKSSFDKNGSEETRLLECHHESSHFVIRISSSNRVWQ